MLSQSLRNHSKPCLGIVSTLLPIAAACSSSPTSPMEISQLSLGAAYDVFVEGETAYVSNNQGVAILDIGDIDHPRRIATVREGSTNSIVNFHLSGDTLFTYGDRFSTYDLRGDGEPRLLNSLSGRDYVAGAQKRGSYLYLAYLHGGLEIIDYRDPSEPIASGYAAASGWVNDMALVGDHVYLANSSTGLEVYDITNPSSPARLGVVSGSAGASDIHIRDGLLYLACNIHGVKVLDLADPAEPQVIGSFSNGGESWGVFAQGSFLYTADLDQGVEVLDISDPATPTLAMSDGHYHPHDLSSDGRYLYLADQDVHFVVLPLDLEGE